MFKILYRFLIGLFSLLVLLGHSSDIFLHNALSLALVQAIMNPSLAYENRVSFFDKIIQQKNNIKFNKRNREIFNVVFLEKEDILQSQKYLNTIQEFQQLEVGRQLLINPYFDFGALGWIQYGTVWNVSRAINEAVAKTTRQGKGQGALTQILYLKPDNCYLFLVEASIIRRDDTFNYWLYWESYKNDRVQKGQSIIRNQGDQPRQQYLGVFCIPKSDKELEKIGVAPFKAYGDVTVTLNSAKLYELRHR